MTTKNKPYDEKALLATIVKMTQGTVVQKLGMQGRDFYNDQVLYDGKTLLQEARTEIMYNVLEEIADKIGRPLIAYTQVEKYDEKTKSTYTETEKTILLDEKSIKTIEKSLDKAIVQMAKEVNTKVDKVHKQAVKTAVETGQKPPQMNELRYNQYLLEAGKMTEASKFISDMQQNKLHKETKSSFMGLVSSFKVAIQRVFSKPISSLDDASLAARKAPKKLGKHAERVANTKGNNEGAPLLR
jgi:hypothetical protein